MDPKPLHFVGSSRDDIRDLPRAVRVVIGSALYDAQRGEKPANAKPLKGFKGASVLEVIENYDGDTYRAVYTIKFRGVVYVLHCFKKKSKKGVSTPKPDIELINQRLKAAKDHHDAMYVSGGK